MDSKIKEKFVNGQKRLQLLVKSIKHRPQEKEQEVDKLIRKAEREAKEILEKQGIKGGMGYCHMVWGLKKEILKNKYGIDWKSPSEMNPHINYD